MNIYSGCRFRWLRLCPVRKSKANKPAKRLDEQTTLGRSHIVVTFVVGEKF